LSPSLAIEIHRNSEYARKKLEIPRSRLSYLIESDLKPPQSYCTLDKNKPWFKAVSIAALLQANFRNTKAHLQP